MDDEVLRNREIVERGDRLIRGLNALLLRIGGKVEVNEITDDNVRDFFENEKKSKSTQETTTVNKIVMVFDIFVNILDCFQYLLLADQIAFDRMHLNTKDNVSIIKVYPEDKLKLFLPFHGEDSTDKKILFNRINDSRSIVKNLSQFLCYDTITDSGYISSMFYILQSLSIPRQESTVYTVFGKPGVSSDPNSLAFAICNEIGILSKGSPLLNFKIYAEQVILFNFDVNSILDYRKFLEITSLSEI